MKSIKLTIEIPEGSPAISLLDPAKEKALQDFAKYIRTKWHLPIRLAKIEHTPEAVHIKLK